MIPPKLKAGDNLRVIAPSHSFSKKFTKEMRERTAERFAALGLKVSYGKYVDETDDFKTATIEHRMEDLHGAFADSSVQAIIPAKGGASASQLLKYLDYDLIKSNPKIFCGLSDITELANAINAQTELVTYYGPHYTMAGASMLIDYSIDYFKKAFLSQEPFQVSPSKYYSNTEWSKEVILNDGFWLINKGEVEARCIGGNLRTISLTIGSDYVPKLEGKIVFLEDNKIIDYRGVQKELQAILNHPKGDKIAGLIFGRFQVQTGMTKDLLTKIIKSKKELENVPVIGNVDFGHTIPMVSLPIGGSIRMVAKNDADIKLEIVNH
ncbi:LD-carboxypeptidase [Parapedobacter deserti]|uniref:LD-carboxypeptidase n=1 Tax=Parapedobacter deserti TaxID=1912957 RepID=A0ABV7JLI9_9SPHI